VQNKTSCCTQGYKSWANIINTSSLDLYIHFEVIICTVIITEFVQADNNVLQNKQKYYRTCFKNIDNWNYICVWILFYKWDEILKYNMEQITLAIGPVTGETP
jgi:hypothetical protein